MVLNDRALKVYAQIALLQCADYDYVRSVIVDAFKANADTYLHRMQTAKRSGTESYKLFVGRPREYQSHYLQCRNIDSFDKLKEDMLLNLFLASLPSNVNEFVKARTPKSLTDAAESADLWISIKGSNVHVKMPDGKKDNPSANRHRNLAEIGKNDASNDVVVTDFRKTSTSKQLGHQPKVKGACWTCGSTEHKRSNCSVAQKKP
jgi:hypothetical protein